jgi:homospermidine synthase
MNDTKIAILGFGSIGSGLIPLLLKHFDRSQISIIGADSRNLNIAVENGIEHKTQPVTKDNYREILSSWVKPGDFLVNLSVDVSSKALVIWCRENGVLYLDTCIEPWAGFYDNPGIAPERRSNYALRQEMLDLRDSHGNAPGATAILAHGANPGLVNHFVKRALLDVAKKVGYQPRPNTKDEWCLLAQSIGLKVIHIAERDTQTPTNPKEVGEFVNTWSIDGFVGEGLQPSEIGWGSHEKTMPSDGNHFEWGCKSAIWLSRPGCVTKVRSWTPAEGPYQGWIITHNESIGISDFFTKDGYRPTVHYAYHPCDSAVLSMHELAGKNYQQQQRQRLIVDEVVSGVDELGVLLMGDFGAYWYGSYLDVETARSLAPYNNATSLQVVAPVLAGILWAIKNPSLGIVEPDDLPFEEILSVTDPYMGKLVGEWTDWTPLQDRCKLFPEDVDLLDAWQFKNFRVS